MLLAIAVSKYSCWMPQKILRLILNRLQTAFSKGLKNTSVGIWNLPQEWQPASPGVCDLEVFVLAMNFPGELAEIRQITDEESNWMFETLDAAGLRGFVYVLPAVGEPDKNKQEAKS